MIPVPVLLVCAANTPVREPGKWRYHHSISKYPGGQKPRGIFLVLTSQVALRATYSVKKPWRAFCARVILVPARLTRPRTAWEFAKLPFCSAKPRFLWFTPIHPLKSRSAPQRRDFIAPRGHAPRRAKAQRDFLVPTSYPRSRSANSAKNRLGVCKTPILLRKTALLAAYLHPSLKIPAGKSPEGFSRPVWWRTKTPVSEPGKRRPLPFARVNG